MDKLRLLLAQDKDKILGTVALIMKDVPGAWPTGTRVRKTVKHEDDAHEIGAEAVVLGCMGKVEYDGKEVYGYYVYWDDMPGVPVLVNSQKIEVIADTKEG